MSYSTNILADSVNPLGDRLTTLEVTLPRFLLAEFNTHRMLSRNSASSRAIPTEQQIERVLEDPFVPTFNARVKGMGIGEALANSAQIAARKDWLDARDAAVKAARSLLHIDKSRANRLLEPFAWQTIIVSATDWANFFALRDHDAAQPEFRRAAVGMRRAMEASTPQELGFGQWHLPLVFDRDREKLGAQAGRLLAEVSAGRCARVSYVKHSEDETAQKSANRWALLCSAGHWSPGEHPARVVNEPEHYRRPSIYYGNFRGFVQLRKHYPNEPVFAG